jgi:cell wall-associated NlpC family hydrolase
VRLPRDAELQVAVGTRVNPGTDFRHLRPGDLLFFTEVPGRITHVGLSMGGPGLIHSALSNGGVATNRLTGDAEPEPALRRMFVEARRVL